MAVDEHARHELYNQLTDVLGPGHARTLMEHLPPAGWGEVATRRDLEVVEHRLVATMRGEITAQTRLLVFSMLAVLFTAVSLAFTAARLG
jgi:hypothetical protein